MEIEEKQQDKAKLGIWAILMKDEYMNLHVVNCQLKALCCDSATLSITYRTCSGVDQTLRCTKAYGFIGVGIQIIHWLSIMTK
jgi:hypothetical protein